MVFDDTKCADGLHALENYAYEWDEDRQIFKPKPLHNWASHGASAGRYAALAAAQIKGNISHDTPMVRTSYKSGAWMG